MDGGWSDFGDWSKCSAGCGIMTRRRTCTNPPPSNGGACCDYVEAKSCNTEVIFLGARLSDNTDNADILFEFPRSFFVQPHSCGNNPHLTDIR